MPEYFGADHLDAMAYAMTAGPEYLHQALDIAIKENNAYVALGVVEALAANAGEQSLLYRIGIDQPLVKALTFNDTAVKYSAAIAIASAGPKSDFMGSSFVVDNLASAIRYEGREKLGDELSDIYALRSIKVMLNLAATRNKVIDLSKTLQGLIVSTKDEREQMQILAGQVLAHLFAPDAQQAIAEMALLEDNSMDVRIGAFESLSTSAKINGMKLTNVQVDKIYTLISSNETETELRSTAASAYGALNLPSKRVKDLILDQAVN